MFTDFTSITSISTFCTIIIPQLIVIYLIIKGVSILSFEANEKSKSRENKENTKNSLLSNYNAKPFDFNISNGLILVSLGVLLQMFMIIYSKDIDKLNEKVKVIAEKSELKNEDSQNKVMSFTINNNPNQEQTITPNTLPTKNTPTINKIKNNKNENECIKSK